MEVNADENCKQVVTITTELRVGPETHSSRSNSDRSLQTRSWRERSARCRTRISTVKIPINLQVTLCKAIIRTPIPVIIQTHLHPGSKLKETHPFNNKAQSHGEENYTESQRAEIEKAEDEFVNQTEEAVGVMKNVLDTPEPLKNLAELIAAQLEFHKRAYEILSELAPEVDQLQLDQEVSSARSTPPSTQVTQF